MYASGTTTVLGFRKKRTYISNLHMKTSSVITKNVPTYQTYGAGHLTWPTGTYHFRRGRYLGSHGRSGPKVGAIDASTKSAKVPIAPGPTTRSLGFIEGPEGGPAAAAYLDGQPGISGRMGEADSAQPTRNGPCHRRLGFGLDPGLISLADGHFYTKSVSVSLSILRTGSSSVRMGSLP